MSSTRSRLRRGPSRRCTGPGFGTAANRIALGVNVGSLIVGSSLIVTTQGRACSGTPRSASSAA